MWMLSHDRDPKGTFTLSGKLRSTGPWRGTVVSVYEDTQDADLEGRSGCSFLLGQGKKRLYVCSKGGGTELLVFHVIDMKPGRM